MPVPVPANPFANPPKPHFVPAGVMVEVAGADGRLVDEWALARIEELDDTIFNALEGDAEALDKAAQLWRRIRRTAPVELVDESRDQYLRRAETILQQSRETPSRSLGRQFAALEILALMAE